MMPSSGISMIVTTRRIRPKADKAAPGRSRRGRDGSFDSGTRITAAMKPTVTSTGLTQKIACHENCSSSTPPTMGPRATPSPATAAQMPIACARSVRSWNT